MTTDLEPKRPNDAGVTPCSVQWVVETGAGWLGAWNREAFDAYADAKVAEERERLRAMVAAVRDANCEAQERGTFRLPTLAQDQAWLALLDALEPTKDKP